MKKHFLVTGFCAGLALASCTGSKNNTAADTINKGVEITGTEPIRNTDTLNVATGDTTKNNRQNAVPAEVGSSNNDGGLQ